MEFRARFSDIISRRGGGGEGGGRSSGVTKSLLLSQASWFPKQKPSGFELFYANAFFFSNKFA